MPLTGWRCGSNVSMGLFFVGVLCSPLSTWIHSAFSRTLCTAITWQPLQVYSCPLRDLHTGSSTPLTMIMNKWCLTENGCHYLFLSQDSSELCLRNKRTNAF